MVLTQRDLIQQACRQAVGVLKFTNWRVDHRKLPLLVYTCTCYFSQRGPLFTMYVYTFATFPRRQCLVYPPLPRL